MVYASWRRGTREGTARSWVRIPILTGLRQDWNPDPRHTARERGRPTLAAGRRRGYDAIRVRRQWSRTVAPLGEGGCMADSGTDRRTARRLAVACGALGLALAAAWMWWPRRSPPP